MFKVLGGGSLCRRRAAVGRLDTLLEPRMTIQPPFHPPVILSMVVEMVPEKGGRD